VCFIFQDDVAQTLTEHWTIYKKRSESFPRLPKPVKSHLARYNKKKKSFCFRIKKILCKDR